MSAHRLTHGFKYHLCPSSVEGLFLSGKAVFDDFLPDQVESLLDLFQLNPEVLRQQHRVLSLQGKKHGDSECFVFLSIRLSHSDSFLVEVWLIISKY